MATGNPSVRLPLSTRSNNLHNLLQTPKRAQATTGITKPGLLDVKPNRSVAVTPSKRILDPAKVGSTRKSAKRTYHDSPNGRVAPPNLLAPGTKKARVNAQEEASMKTRIDLWVKQYRDAFPSFRFYFDNVDPAAKAKVSQQIRMFGGHVEPYFSNQCTHVVTTRPIPTMADVERIEREAAAKPAAPAPAPAPTPLSILGGLGDHLLKKRAAAKVEEPQDESDEAKDVLVRATKLNLKIWTWDKCVNRILKNLLEYCPEVAMATTQQTAPLQALLREEKVYGTMERDPTAPGGDWVSFKGPYIIVRDLTGVHRPIMIREYKKVEKGKERDDNQWPQLRATSLGRCPFVRDPHVGRTVKPNTAATAATALPQKLAATQNALQVPFRESKVNILDNFAKPLPASRASRGGYRPRDIDASGVMPNSLTSAIKSQTSTALTGPREAPPSKQVMDMKRKVLQAGFDAQSREHVTRDANVKAIGRDVDAIRAAPAHERKRAKVEVKAGYCENCKEKYEDFERHIVGKRHRKFAKNDDNFVELDQLLREVARRPRVQ
ncbi:Cdc7p-Dbf4p kinase complex regulatory subunit [Saitoella coloradoensis]